MNDIDTMRFALFPTQPLIEPSTLAQNPKQALQYTVTQRLPVPGVRSITYTLEPKP